MNKAMLNRALVLGENQSIAYKSTLEVHGLGLHVCAFLNSGGGYIVCGVENSGETSGLVFDNAEIARLEKTLHAKISPKALISFEVNVLEGHQVLVIEVPSGKDIPYAFDNEIYIRKNERSMKADLDTIRDMVLRRQIEPERWERRFSSADIASDLSLEEVV